MLKHIPKPVTDIVARLQENGFEAYAVGGCVRDLILEREPKDWDITTDALPEEVIKIFPDSFYENDFGTVGVKVERFSTKPRTSNDGSRKNNVQPTEDGKHDIVEITTYRIESEYTDKRRPKEVIFTKSLEKDLARRDFTINAIAYGPNKIGKWGIVDLFNGAEDLQKKIIRTVGNPEERLNEDALRLMRAVRFFAELRDSKEQKPTHNWRIEEKTFQAIQKLAEHLEKISSERIRDELAKIILSDSPSEGIEMLEKASLLCFILPELREGIGVTQNLHHIYTVWEHNLRALSTCPSQKLETRLAALLHDVGKPRAKRGEGYNSTFYSHDHIGSRIAEKMLTRLRFPKEVVKKTTLLVDNHLFYYNVGEVTEASVRRLIKRVGLENMDDLMAVRIGDRLGSGVPKAKPYKLRHLEYIIEKVSQDPISAKMLAINGTNLISELKIPAGPKIGAILDVLLSEVIEDPKLNNRELLLQRADRLKKSDLETLRAKAEEKIQEKISAEDEQIKKRHWVE
jgi:poly(A) polymerase/tRNA nucleotidyltransferase (CCA-adding enzyme)